MEVVRATRELEALLSMAVKVSTTEAAVSAGMATASRISMTIIRTYREQDLRLSASSRATPTPPNEMTGIASAIPVKIS